MRFFGFNNPTQGAVTGVTLATAAWLLLTSNTSSSLLFKLAIFAFSPLPELAGIIGFRIGEIRQENDRARLAPRV